MPNVASTPVARRRRRSSPRARTAASASPVPIAPAMTPRTTLSSAGEHEQIAAARAARAQQRQAPPVALDRAEGRQVREAERDERTGNGEHDVERLGVERVAGCRVEVVGEVVDEDDLARQRALDAVPDLRRLRERVRRASASAPPGRPAPAPATAIPV